MRLKFLSIAALFCMTAAFAADNLSMSDADKQLYSSDENPGDLYVEKGETLFKKTFGSTKVLADFLGVQPQDLAAEIASYPKFLPKVGDVVALDGMLQQAMHEKGLVPLKMTSEDMVQMMSYVKSIANGKKVTVDTKSEHAAAYYKLGEETYNTRRGLRGLSCNSCHSQGVLGMRLRMQILPNLGAADIKSGATWPAYRMTKSELTTMQKRFQGCMNNSSQAVLPIGSKEMVALELYVTSLANGMEMAIPGLKR
jgi:L-cysteine S-thiosulfotransferase